MWMNWVQMRSSWIHSTKHQSSTDISLISVNHSPQQQQQLLTLHYFVRHIYIISHIKVGKITALRTNIKLVQMLFWQFYFVPLFSDVHTWTHIICKLDDRRTRNLDEKLDEKKLHQFFLYILHLHKSFSYDNLPKLKRPTTRTTLTRHHIALLSNRYNSLQMYYPSLAVFLCIMLAKTKYSDMT